MIYKDIIAKIKETLEKVDEIGSIYPYPIGKETRPESYPFAMFFPDNIDNSFSDTASNRKTLTFQLYLTVNIANITTENVYTDVLPTLVDAVLREFDKDWDYGTSVAGYRTWCQVQNGNWGLVDSEAGLEAFANLTIQVDYSNSTN